MKLFAILRIIKIKTLRKLRSFHDHNYRKKDLKHVDNKKSKNNVYFDASTTIQQKIDRRFKETGVTPGKNNVKLLEVLLTASEDGMSRIISEGRFEDWRQENKRFIEDEFGKGNNIDYALHLDEAGGSLDDERGIFGARSRIGGQPDSLDRAVAVFY